MRKRGLNVFGMECEHIMDIKPHRRPSFSGSRSDKRTDQANRRRAALHTTSILEYPCIYSTTHLSSRPPTVFITWLVERAAMPATWLSRSANNLNCLSQRLRIPLLAPQFPRPRAYPQRHPAYFSTSSRHLDPQPEPKAETQPESPPDEGDQLLQALQDVRDGNRNRKLVRQHFSRNARNDSGPQKVRRMLSNAEAKGSALRVQKKPELPPPDYVGQYIHLLKDIYAEDRLMPWYEESLKLSLPLVR